MQVPKQQQSIVVLLPKAYILTQSTASTRLCPYNLKHYFYPLPESPQRIILYPPCTLPFLSVICICIQLGALNIYVATYH